MGNDKERLSGNGSLTLESLCESCELKGRVTCEFRKTAESIAKSTKKGSLFEVALNKHDGIALERSIARSKNCPHIHGVDPYYLGRELL